MKKICQIDNFTFYKYKPSILKPFYINLEPISFKRRIRFFLAFFTGYKVYYMKENSDYIGFCVVQNGKDIRYKFATGKDIIIGPYFIMKEYRGRKLSIMLLDFILHEEEGNYKFVYDYIQKNNLPSIKASKAVGFEYFSDANLSRFLRTINLCKYGKGEYIIYKYC